MQPYFVELNFLLDSLKERESLEEKIALLKSSSKTVLALSHLNLENWASTLDLKGRYAVYAVAAIGQAPFVFQGVLSAHEEALQPLIEQLIAIEAFYEPIGGIVGYQLTLIGLILRSQSFTHERVGSVGIKPEGLDLAQLDTQKRGLIRRGIESIGRFAELYPVGGAADRLHLLDPQSKSPLPAALLPFLGRSLLEGLIRDLQAREYLAFKLTGKQMCVPVGMMTSSEKENHTHILKICEEHGWFHRPRDHFSFFIQPLAPTVSEDGNWALSAPYTLHLKPGGHGVIWKLAQEAGFFARTRKAGMEFCLVRQINNPLGGVDSGLLALAGMGVQFGKSMGFLSCKRLLNSPEGMNVVIESQNAARFSYSLTNIEYTDLTLFPDGESPEEPGSPFSAYPSNTNLLFVRIEAVEQALEERPFPGLLVNMKTTLPFLDPEKGLIRVRGGRLESIMQNIADSFVDSFDSRLSPAELMGRLQTFILYNERKKTLSTTKKMYKEGEVSEGTPEQAYFDLTTGLLEKLAKDADVQLPPPFTLEQYLYPFSPKGGEIGSPHAFPIHLIFHPALGPIYEVMAQKISGGHWMGGSELQLEIAELELVNLELQGTLLIESASPLGRLNQEGILEYGRESRCSLHSVAVRNRGIDWQAPQLLWKNQVNRLESARILLHEGAEFEARHLILEGDCFFEVPADHRLTLTQDAAGVLHQELTPILSPSWKWDYRFLEDHSIHLQKLVLTNY